MSNSTSNTTFATLLTSTSARLVSLRVSSGWDDNPTILSPQLSTPPLKR